MTDTPVIAGHTRPVEDALHHVLRGRELPLYRMMAYQLGWVNERGEAAGFEPPLRVLGALVLEVASASGASQGIASPGAAAVELLRNSWQIHEDVAGGCAERRGRASVLGVWGPAQAINAGDGMHAVARLALFVPAAVAVPPERAAACLEALDTTAAQLSEAGYHGSDSRRESSGDTDAYLQAVCRREGALAGCAARLGGLAMREAHSADLAAFGAGVGAAQRLSGDLDLFWGDDADSGRERTRLATKRSMPVEHALANGTPDIRRGVRTVCEKQAPAAQDVAALARMLEDSGSKEFTEKTIDRLLADAGAALSRAELGENAVARLLRLAREIAGTPVV